MKPSSAVNKTIIWLFLLLLGCLPDQEEKKAVPDPMPSDPITKLEQLDQPLEAPRYGEWLYAHREKGQTFQQYVSLPPVTVTKTRNVIYIQPIGIFTLAQSKVVKLTAQYLALFFGLKAVVAPTLSDKIVPASARRLLEKENEQLNAPYILDSVLLKRVPVDAVAYMAVTAKDLYPKPSWNYVFGLANTKQRVGVSSIYRYSEQPLNSANYQKCLERLIKTSAHELGHMFSMRHCVKSACVMNGSNSLSESDRQPSFLCSQCLKKLHWNLKFNLAERNQQLAQFFQNHQLLREQDYYAKAQAILDEK